MPRQSRIDALGALRRIIIRGTPLTPDGRVSGDHAISTCPGDHTNGPPGQRYVGMAAGAFRGTSQGWVRTYALLSAYQRPIHSLTSLGGSQISSLRTKISRVKER